VVNQNQAPTELERECEDAARAVIDYHEAKFGADTDIRLDGPTVDIHVPKMPKVPWLIARGAATIDGIPVGLWIAKAILHEWERRTNYGAY